MIGATDRRLPTGIWNSKPGSYMKVLSSKPGGREK